MRTIYADVDVGRKNLTFGIALFLLFGIGVGIPLTINFLGGSVLTPAQYQAWKVVHGYGIFLGFINYFFGLSIDRLRLTRQQKEISSWSFVIAGLFSAVIRMTLLLVPQWSSIGLYVSLGETVFITLGTIFFVLGQIRGSASVKVQPRPLDQGRHGPARVS